MSESVTIRGTVRKIFFVNPETPAMAGVLLTDEGEVRFAGKCAAQEGDLLEVTGEWGDHPRFGRQFMADTGMVKLDESPSALIHLLARDKRFAGLGPVKAERLVTAALKLSEDGTLATALEEHTTQVANLAGVSLEIVENAADIWMEKRSHFDALAALIDQGWTNGQAQTIVHFIGEAAAPLIKSAPYQLISLIPRFGFRTVDVVALRMGVASGDPQRLSAGLAYCLDRIATEGNTWTTREGLIDAAITELRPDTLDAEDRILTNLRAMIKSGAVYQCDSPTGVPMISDARIARIEIEVFDQLLEGLGDDTLGELTIPATGSFGTLNNGQRAAALGFSLHRYTVISGGAGVGKTYTMKSICETADANDLRVGLCAPTGKAARKLHHATGRTAMTIHRLLEPHFDEQTGRFAFRRNAGNWLELDLVIIDEISMVDVRLMSSLLSALNPHTRLLLVGDHHQIPSVGAGAILRDLLAARAEYPDAVHILTDIVRQAGELARNTSAILEGKVTPQIASGKVWQLRSIERGHEEGTPAMVATVVDYVVNAPNLHPFDRQLDFEWEVQVLSPQRKGPLGVFALNTALQKLRQRLLGNSPPPPVEKDKPPRPLQGDRVIWTKNDYELNLMNGTQAILVGKQKGAMVLFTEDGREVVIPPSKNNMIDLAYALTIHKSQGSEWPFVILIASSKHWNMHDRNLLYTGASRASEALMIMGDGPGVQHFAATRKSAQRSTFGGFLVHGWRPDPQQVVGQ